MKSKIKIGGKEYPCRMTMGALLRFKRETGHDVSELSQNDTAELLTLLHCAVVSASKADGVEFGLSLEDFADGLDVAEMNAFYRALETGEKKTSKA